MKEIRRVIREPGGGAGARGGGPRGGGAPGAGGGGGGGVSRGCGAAPPYLRRFRKAVMMIALVKSMKKAPTIGTTRKARGAGAYFSTSTPMLATALAVVPSMKPQT